MKQRERIGLLPPVRTSDVLVFSSRRKPFRRRDNGVARTPRVRTPFFKRMARRLRTARLMERAGLRFVAAPRRLEAAYDDDRADARGEGRTDAVVEREREEEKEERDEGPDDDGDAEDDDVDRSASSSDSDEAAASDGAGATRPEASRPEAPEERQPFVAYLGEFLDDVFVPDEDVIGESNDGWRAAMSTSSNERFMTGSSVG